MKNLMSIKNELKPTMLITKAKADHAPSILEIYNYYVDTSVATFHLNKVSLDYVSQQLAKTKYPYYVAVNLSSGSVVGYCYTNEYRPRGGYDKTLEISIYLNKNYLYTGIGSLLISQVEEDCRALEYKCLLAITGAKLQEDPSGLKFYLKNGFLQVGRLPYTGRKFNQWLDTVIFSKLIN